MRNSATRKIWILAFLMAICVAGCGREQTVNPAPLLVSTLPANGATSVPVAKVAIRKMLPIETDRAQNLHCIKGPCSKCQEAHANTPNSTNCGCRGTASL